MKFCKNCNTLHETASCPRCYFCDSISINVDDKYDVHHMFQLLSEFGEYVDDEYRPHTRDNNVSREVFGTFIQKKFGIINVDEEIIPVTLFTIKNVCGFSEFADVTGTNPYMLNEFNVSDSEIFYVKKSHAIKLGLM